jgi:hypothetical protein
MKKLLAILAAGTLSYSASAQELTSKKGIPILPEAGDLSISFNAVPFLNYAFDKTRIMSSSSASSAAGALDYSISNNLVGKYMDDVNKAYRGRLQLNFARESKKEYVDKTGSTTGETVENTEATSTSNVTIGGGLQYYRGKGRLRGYYGGEGLLSIGSGPSKSFTYGNALDVNSEPQSRTKEEKAGMTFGLGVRGFIGAEYFFAPKMSIGAEFGWGIGFESTGDGEKTEEISDGSAVKSVTTKTGGNSKFNLGVDNAGGAINLAIYF